MPTHVLIIDYNDNRRNQLRKLIEAKFKDYTVTELETSSPDPPRDTDADKLTQVRAGDYDLLIGHIGGNPSGYECLKTFKDYNPKGKAVLYTKQQTIPLESLDGLKLADAVFKRSDEDAILFENADEMMDVIRKVMEEPGVVFWENPFKQPAVLTAIVALLAAIVGLIAALVKAFFFIRASLS